MRSSKPRRGRAGPAWKAATDYGIDMSQIEASLARTPAERILTHRAALGLVCTLRHAMEKRDARP